ncbi:hypothetical protein KR018_002703 [Drosophila ironensis]|nr:hypothetical protein KR018_002703 [Drosophila ironensis]
MRYLGSVFLVKSLCLIFVLSPDVSQLSQAANILGVFPYRHLSAFSVIRPLITALVAKGHNMTIISPNHMMFDIEGVRHLRVPMLNKQRQDIIDSDQLMDFFRTKWLEARLAATLLSQTVETIILDHGVQQMMRNKDERFDLIIMEASHLDAMYGLAEYYNATLMGLACMRLNWKVDDLAGNSAPSIYEPVSPIGYSMDASLLGRLYNVIHISEERMLDYLLIQPAQLRMFKKYFGYSTEKMEELRSRFSVILVNNHFSMGRVRPNVPNIVEIGGIHLSEPPEPCDEQLQRFLDEAKHGVIYFSLGLEVLMKFLPENMQEPLLQAFGQVQQRVVWKSEIESMPNTTDKIYYIAKSPQRAILRHPNIRLFITHGGLLSIMEAIECGVPMLGLPMFFDQFANMHRMQKAGIAEVLDSNALDAVTLTNSIRELIGNPRYTHKAKEMASSFMDRPMSPLDTAVWWTEYALRHRDVTHIRLNKNDVPLILYYQLDSLMSMGLRFGFVIGSMIFLVCKLIKKQRIRQQQVQERRERGFHYLNMPLIRDISS